jgi:large subunit ribosomal protein L29
MAKTKTSELRELTDAQLEEKLTEAREEEFRLKFRSATEAIDNPMRYRTLRREIARLQTLLREKRGQ